MYTDPIADFLTRVRNAIAAGHRVVEIPASNLKKEMTKILFDQGYILSYQFNDDKVQGTIKIALKYAEKRKALKEAGDYEALQKLPKNASPIRLHNRCKLTGRPKGYMRQFGISRVTFREMANQGLIPGVKKASW